MKNCFLGWHPGRTGIPSLTTTPASPLQLAAGTRHPRSSGGTHQGGEEQRWRSEDASCPCLRHHRVKHGGSLQRTVSGRPGSKVEEPMWVRNQTGCSADKSSCRPLRNDSSFMPRWGVCLLRPSLSKERKGGWYESEAFYIVSPGYQSGGQWACVGTEQESNQETMGSFRAGWSRELSRRGGGEETASAEVPPCLCLSS